MVVEIFENNSFTKEKMVLYLTVIQSSKKQSVKDAYKRKLFSMFGDIVQKSVNNFFSLCRDKNIVSSLEEEDILSECYIVFHKSIEKMNFSYKNNFHFYYNKSITRSLYRVFQKLLREKSHIKNYEDITVVTRNKTNQIAVDLTDYYCERMHFSKLQKKIVKNKVDPKFSVDEFVIKNKITKKKYKDELAFIETKMKDFFKELNDK